MQYTYSPIYQNHYFPPGQSNGALLFWREKGLVMLKDLCINNTFPCFDNLKENLAFLLIFLLISPQKSKAVRELRQCCFIKCNIMVVRASGQSRSRGRTQKIQEFIGFSDHTHTYAQITPILGFSTIRALV